MVWAALVHIGCQKTTNRAREAPDTDKFSAEAGLMEVNLCPEIQAKLAYIAAENNSEAEEDVHEPVEHYLDDDA